MLCYLRNPFVSLMLGVVLVTACATAQVSSVWRDPAYQARPARVMVIGVVKNPLNRRLFEDEFVLQLKARGTDAIASYTVLSDKLQDDQAAIAAKVKELGADTILITRVVSKKTVKTYVPGTAYYFPDYFPDYYGTWHHSYGYGYHYLYSPGYIAEDQYAMIETNLYETLHDKLVWAASSETVLSGSKQERIKSYIGIMLNNMAENGLVGK